MNEAEKARAQAICHEEEMARAKFEAQLRAHRDKTARLRAQARQEASWLERRKSTMAVIRAGLADLREKTTRMRTTRSAKVG